MGQAVVRELVNFDLVNDLDDVFELHRHREKLSDLPGWGDRSVSLSAPCPHSRFGISFSFLG